MKIANEVYHCPIQILFTLIEREGGMAQKPKELIKKGTIKLVDLDNEQLLIMKLAKPLKPGETIGSIIIKPADQTKGPCKGTCCDATCHGNQQR
ncbi:hypothetical protein [uncultured Desulfosarcina sp.]|uniref:hypothetical protein n=1 Tax=uncultured Desulfosarcina sp. TaxID=218289 RepID=UPI0029C69B9F|nr:hypothetical protein [uncultured Desulfosarcina sp.]